jgi:four helix bundle protein
MAGDFADLRVWTDSVAIVREVAGLVRSMREPAARGASEQMLRAAESIPANIAEGYGRGLGDDFARFLRVAAASAAELESHLHVSVACGRLPPTRVQPVIGRARALRAMIRGLASSVAARGGR